MSISLMTESRFTPAASFGHTARKEFETSEASGNRARQSCGFFTSGFFMAGRARIQHPQGKAAHRLASGFNLPAAMQRRLKPTPYGISQTQQGVAMQATLPQVVEFDHRHVVKVINDGNQTRIIATPNPKWAGQYKRMHELPFVGKPANWDHLCWWFFPKAANEAEAEERGAFFWNEFVAFSRGTRRGRQQDAADLLRYVLDAMPHFPDGQIEAGIFRRKLIEATVAHLRAGVEL